MEEGGPPPRLADSTAAVGLTFFLVFCPSPLGVRKGVRVLIAFTSFDGDFELLLIDHVVMHGLRTFAL